MLRAAMTLAAVILLAACGPARSTESFTDAESSGSASSATPDDETLAALDDDDDEAEETVAQREFDEGRAREAAEDEVGSDTYIGSGSTYGCTDDCSGHEAGFEYARDHGYEDAMSTPSQSFDEGHRAFGEAVEEKLEEKRAAFESGDTEYDQ